VKKKKKKKKKKKEIRACMCVTQQREKRSNRSRRLPPPHKKAKPTFYKTHLFTPFIQNQPLQRKIDTQRSRTALMHSLSFNRLPSRGGSLIAQPEIRRTWYEWSFSSESSCEIVSAMEIGISIFLAGGWLMIERIWTGKSKGSVYVDDWFRKTTGKDFGNVRINKSESLWSEKMRRFYY